MSNLIAGLHQFANSWIEAAQFCRLKRFCIIFNKITVAAHPFANSVIKYNTQHNTSYLFIAFIYIIIIIVLGLGCCFILFCSAVNQTYYYILQILYYLYYAPNLLPLWKENVWEMFVIDRHPGSYISIQNLIKRELEL